LDENTAALLAKIPSACCRIAQKAFHPDRLPFPLLNRTEHNSSTVEAMIAEARISSARVREAMRMIDQINDATMALRKRKRYSQRLRS